ncbi:MAG: hypothetical protein KKH11_02835 [Candidatus Omnitrophica bacterium]|nr:hypothetical protein [Candidatus Omnitrophota bacterium]
MVALTFGTFSNLEKGESTREQIRSMLGEPAEKLFENDREVWQYHFFKSDRKETGSLQTILNLEISFKEDEIHNYKITVSKKSIQEKQEDVLREKTELLPSKQPFQPRTKTGGDFIQQFDRDNDSRVSRKEFPGPDKVFNLLDKNNNGYIDKYEAPKETTPRRRKSR